MKYKVRLNPKAYNPLTGKVVASRVWEVEQCASRDSERVLWHCTDVRIDLTPIRELYALSKPGEKPREVEYFGICVRGQDNVVEIYTRRPDVSGN